MSKKLVNSFNRVTNPYSPGASIYYNVYRPSKKSKKADSSVKSDDQLRFEFEVDLTLPLIALTAICLFLYLV